MTVLLLYAITWVGGWITYARDLEASAQAKHRQVQEDNARWLVREPSAELPLSRRLREGGPATGVNWCVPVLPGILVVDMYEFHGPHWGVRGYKLVLFYGTGTAELGALRTTI